MLKGTCLCGDVRFELFGEPQSPTACHCWQCNKQSGGIWCSAQVSEDHLEITGEVKWFEASETARRGFCPRCGSFLFWKAHDETTISFALGAIDGPTGLKLSKHIFVAEKGDYYEIADGVPQED